MSFMNVMKGIIMEKLKVSARLKVFGIFITIFSNVSHSSVFLSNLIQQQTHWLSII